MNVGDRVRVITAEFEKNAHAPHFGCLGTITSFAKPDLWQVMRDGRDEIWYGPEHLEVLGQPVMVCPMELSEIEEAEHLMEELSK